MDDSLKARLIGAVVLVTFAVLLIPELLSGRKTAQAPAADPAERTTRSFTIELGGGTGPAAAQGSAPVAPAPVERVSPPARVTSEPATKSESPASPAQSAAVRETPGPVAAGRPDDDGARPAVVPASEPTPSVKSAAPARGGWSVQVGAFGSAESARRLVAELQQAGYTAYVAPVERSGKTLHRVRVGPQAQRADADRQAGRLAARGLPATVVAND